MSMPENDKIHDIIAKLDVGSSDNDNIDIEDHLTVKELKIIGDFFDRMESADLSTRLLTCSNLMNKRYRIKMDNLKELNSKELIKLKIYVIKLSIRSVVLVFSAYLLISMMSGRLGAQEYLENFIKIFDTIFS